MKLVVYRSHSRLYSQRTKEQVCNCTRLYTKRATVMVNPQGVVVVSEILEGLLIVER